MARRANRKAAAAQPAPKAKKANGRVWKCAVYCRISVKDNGGPEGVSIEAQEAVIRDALAKRDDVRIVKVYRDNGFTGTNFDHRPAFNQMISDIHDELVDCIAVKDLSRFGRNYLEAGYYIERVLPMLGVRLIAISDNVDTIAPEDIAADISVPVKNLVNEIHSRDISRKSRNAYVARAKAGTVKIIKAPYGYVKDPANPARLVMVAEQAAVVRRVFDEYLAGKGTTVIAKGLTADGIMPPGMRSGKEGVRDYWTDSCVRNIVKNPVYTGALVYNRIDASIFSANKGAKRDPEEHIVLEGMHGAVITWEEYDRAQQIKSAKAREWDAGNERRERARSLMPDLFAGVGVTCGWCGHRMSFNRLMYNGGTQGPLYTCPRCSKQGGDEFPRISEGLLRVTVGDEIRRQLALHVAFSSFGQDVASAKRLAKRKAYVERRLVAAKARKQKVTDSRRALYEDYAAGRISERDWEWDKADLDAEAAAAREALESATAAMQAMEAELEPDEAVGEAVAAHGTAPRLSRAIVDELVERIVITGRNEVSITFKFQDYDRRVKALKGVRKC